MWREITVNVDYKIELWKNKLLDLGKRNRLINYRDTKRSNLRIISPDIYVLWESFVINENPIVFPYIEDDIEDAGQPNNSVGSVTSKQSEEESPSEYVITNQSLKEQQKTLRSIREKAKTVIEEQGVNVLYLAFGFLKWFESDHSNQPLKSPLILVPVSITWESINAPFILSLYEDEILLNPTLSYKLEHDFGIKLPVFNSDNSLQSFFNDVKDMIKANGWTVIMETGLSLFSFLKINMYKDLENHKDRISQNPIVRALCGDSSALNLDLLKDINGYDHDKLSNPIDTFLVVDADSSQQDAILCAKRGISFVLQGPPGTGKSQTITNIIAECLADGKKVLFVSEKMAALEVVHKRLVDAGLGDFCLTLHSYKANKKEILEQLRVSLNLSRKKAELNDEAYQKLSRLKAIRDELNDYAEEIFSSVVPLNKTIYEVNGYVANLQDYKEVIFHIDDVANTTPQRFNEYIISLRKFADTIGKLTDDYKNNPWYGSNVPNVTFELRHDINANLNILIPQILDLAQLCNTITDTLHLNVELSYNGVKNAIEILKSASSLPIVPSAWIIGESLEPIYNEINNSEQTMKAFENAISELSAFYSDIQKLDGHWNFETCSEITTTHDANTHFNYIQQMVEVDSCYSKWDKMDDLNSVQTLYEQFKAKITEYIACRTKILSRYEKEILTIDYTSMLTRFKTDYTSIFKFFKGQYRIDKKLIRTLSIEVAKKIDDASIISLLTELRHLSELEQWLKDNADSLAGVFGERFKGIDTDFNDIQIAFNIFEKLKLCRIKLKEIKNILEKFDASECKLKNLFDFLYKGVQTDWAYIRSTLAWAKEFRELVQKHKINQIFIENVCSDQKVILSCSEFEKTLREKYYKMQKQFEWFISLFDDDQPFKSANLLDLGERMKRCLKGQALLEEWIDFRTARECCIKIGLGDYINQIESLSIDKDEIEPIFKKRFYRLWLDAILPQYPAVMNFRRRLHENMINEFSELDKLQFEIGKARIQQRLINNLPSLDRFTSGSDELSILRRELGKQRKIMPIRKLFKEIPNLLLTLKPCLMMSPLSVSLFLEAESYSFDTVIFDEASQICTENAIGAIARGKQVIIAGDSKQLPPTNFFTSTTSDTDFDVEDDDNYDDSNAYESLLDEAVLLPERTLVWHYRSRHEHLIAFSNAKIYHNNLITFPSCIEKIPDIGVEYIFVKDGYYDRGGKKGNPIEAKRVAELVFEHFRKNPNRSLGVIAFGEVQQQAIDVAIRQMRMKNQSFEPFFREDKEEPFFIKNLENVQGDERDTIIFSIGYAKDLNGKMNMYFGPLSKLGGERRLNVAITRAKYNVKLVGSIMPTDIDTERINTEGPKLLRSYIDFAINGPSSILSEVTESDVVQHDSPFEAAVYNFLDRKGYKLETQVGCSGYRIDIAVKHPTLKGRYVLGIECDGASYHSARTARERDRLRQDVLENMGWRIYRIWSTDWIKDPITEGEKLIQAVEAAINEYSEEITVDCLPETDISSEKLLVIDTKDESDNPYGFIKYEPADFSNLPRKNGFLDVCDCIMAIIENDFPIHYELLCQKLAPLYGNQKATVTIRREVDYGLTKLKGKIKKKGDFLYPKNDFPIVIKTPNTRKIEYISTEELAQAMLIIANKCIGSTKDFLIVETARAYGFNRTGEKIRTAMTKALSQLINDGRASEIEGKIIVNAEPMQ